MTVWLLLALVVVAAVWYVDRRARVQGWRIKSHRFPFLCRGRVWVRGVPMELDGWCENCKTGWRYALPHVTFLRASPSDPTRAIVVVCRKCRDELPPDTLVRRYAQWWVDKNERMQANGETPDYREFEQIKSALRVGG
jgi:hypothetical protein